MSKLPKAFKRKDHGKMRDSSAIPKGEYVAKVTESDYVANGNKDGHILKLTIEIQNKKYKGHKVFVNLNLDNPSEKAMEIAGDELATIMDAISLSGALKDSKALHGKLMIVKLGVEEASGKYPEKNVVQYYDSTENASDDDDEETDDDEDENLDDDDDESSDDDEDDDEGDDDEVTAEQVSDLARAYKKENNIKALKKLLGEYDIEKISQISDLEEDDLESLKDDIEEEME